MLGRTFGRLLGIERGSIPISMVVSKASKGREGTKLAAASPLRNSATTVSRGIFCTSGTVSKKGTMNANSRTLMGA